jgi:hypothetical protein
MAEFGSGAQVQFKYVLEVTRGVTPAPAPGFMTVLRGNSFDINGGVEVLESQEVRPDRQTITNRHGPRSVTGTIAGEFMPANWDDWILGALAGLWETFSKSTDVGVTAPDQIVNTGGTLVTDGFRPGDIVTLGGLAVSAENGDYLVTGEPRRLPLSLTTEAEGPAITFDLKGSRADSANEPRQGFTCERTFLDIAESENFIGVVQTQMDIAITPTALPSISFNVIGINFSEMDPTPLDAAPVAAPLNEAYGPADMRISEGGVAMTIMTQLSLSLNDNRTLQNVIGANASPDSFEGNANVSGAASVLFENAAIRNKFVNETPTSMWLRFPDPNDPTEFMAVNMNRVKFNAANIAPPQTGAITQEMPWVALKDAASGTAISFQRTYA